MSTLTSNEQLISRVKAARDRREISLELALDICQALKPPTHETADQHTFRAAAPELINCEHCGQEDDAHLCPSQKAGE